MAFTGTFPVSVGEIRSATTAGGGTALTTTPAFIELPDGTAYVYILARNLAGGATVMKLEHCPYILILKATDQLATAAATTDASQAVQDPSKATALSLNAFDTLANKDALYIGSALPFRGVNVVNTAANSNASVLTVQFWNGSAWTAVAGLSDGTAAAGATMAQSGNVTWTVPATWKTGTLAAIETAGLVPCAAMQGVFWTRWTVSAKLSATVTNTVMLGMSRNTAYGEIIAASGGLPEFYETVRKGFGGIGGYEALTDAGTANFEAFVASMAGYGFATNA